MSDEVLVDRHVRRALVAVSEIRSGLRRRARRREEVTAERTLVPASDGPPRPCLRAWSEPAPGGEPLVPPADPGPLAEAAAAAAGGPTWIEVQTSTLETRLFRPGRSGPDEDELRDLRPLASAAIAVRGARGLLSRTRLGRTLEPLALAADARALAEACDLSRTAADVAAAAAGPVRLVAAVAAQALALLWQAWPGGPLPLPPGVDLVDDARPEGGPLGMSFDGEGSPTRTVVLAGEGAGPEAHLALGCIRPSASDPPLRAPANLCLRPRPAAPIAPAPAGRGFHAIALEEARPGGRGRVALDLLGADASGRGARLTLELDLGAFLLAARPLPGATWWTPAAGAAGSPPLLLVLGQEPLAERYFPSGNPVI